MATQDLHPARQAELLQPIVLATIDLTLVLKQLHWNLRGPHFLAIHEFLDTLVDHTRAISDELAERIVTLGHPARGQAESAQSSPVSPVPDTFITDRQAVELSAERVATTIAVMRHAQPTLGDLDAVTEDLVIGAIATLEKDLWMLRSHLL
jgi:starvation-inducible DNA-binding protein